MNYFAHLYFAKPTVPSHIGNLLGDFRKGVDVASLCPETKRALDNHYVVDRFTDTHEDIKAAKALFTRHTKRFAPVAIDMLFDHFLIRHWSLFSSHSFHFHCEQTYKRLEAGLPLMPSRMSKTVSHMVEHDWFGDYAKIDSMLDAIVMVTTRIKFENRFAECVNDITRHYDALNQCFLSFFPQLIDHMNENSREK
jgi:acyl carrier protein phosphodiesterase